MVVITFDSGTANLYMDGTASTPDTGNDSTISDVAAAFTIGNEIGLASAYDGKIYQF